MMFGNKLLVVDVSGPAPPTSAGVAELPGDVMTLAFTDRLAFSLHPYGEAPWHPADFGKPIGTFVRGHRVMWEDQLANAAVGEAVRFESIAFG